MSIFNQYEHKKVDNLVSTQSLSMKGLTIDQERKDQNRMHTIRVVEITLKFFIQASLLPREVMET